MKLTKEQSEQISELYKYITPADVIMYSRIYSTVDDLIEQLEIVEEAEEQLNSLFRNPETTAEEIFINFANATFIDYIHYNVTQILKRYEKGYILKSEANTQIIGIVDYLQEREYIEQTRAELLADYYACIM